MAVSEASASHTPPPTPSSAAKRDTLVTANVLVLAFLVLVFVLAITIFLVDHYAKASEATSVLGVVIPVAGIVVGLGTGVGVGHASGRSAGRSDTALKIQHDVVPLLDLASSSYENVSNAVVGAGTSRANEDTLRLGSAYEVKVADVNQVAESIAAVRSALTAL